VIAVHPYVKDAPNPNDLEDLPDVNELVDQYRALGKQVWITEWGWWGPDEQRGAEEVDDMVSWAAHTSDVAVFCYFCADDAMVAPFGLVRADGTPKPAAARFTARAGGALSVPLPTPPGPPPAEPQTPEDELFAALWRAHLPHLDYTPFAAESVPAFQKYWRAHPEIGSPVTGEVDLGDGTRGMAFANGVYQWTGGETVERLP
jgi:hypothetical protein